MAAEPLHISQVVQKTFVEVNGSGGGQRHRDEALGGPASTRPSIHNDSGPAFLCGHPGEPDRRDPVPWGP